MIISQSKASCGSAGSGSCQASHMLRPDLECKSLGTDSILLIKHTSLCVFLSIVLVLARNLADARPGAAAPTAPQPLGPPAFLGKLHDNHLHLVTNMPQPMPTTDALAIEALLQSQTPPRAIHLSFPHISRTNIYLRSKLFQQYGTSLRDPASYKPTGRPALITPELETVVRHMYEANQDIELQDVVEEVEKRSGKRVSRSSASRVITRLRGGVSRSKGLKSQRLGEEKRKRRTAEGGHGALKLGTAAQLIALSATDERLAVPDGERESRENAGRGPGNQDVGIEHDKAERQMDAQILDPALSGLPARIRHETPATYPLPGDARPPDLQLYGIDGNVSHAVFHEPYVPVQIP